MTRHPQPRSWAPWLARLRIRHQPRADLVADTLERLASDVTHAILGDPVHVDDLAHDARSDADRARALVWAVYALADASEIPPEKLAELAQQWRGVASLRRVPSRTPPATHARRAQQIPLI